MNKLKLFKVIDLIDEDIIKEAEINTNTSHDTENEKNITVSGVDVYHSSKWQKLAALAAAFLLVAGLGTGGALMFRNRRIIINDDSPALPSDMSEVNPTSPFERLNTDETTTTETKKNEKATKESINNTEAVTTAAKKENKAAVTTDLDPAYAEINLISQSNNTVTTQAHQTGIEEFVSRAQEFPVVTTPDGQEMPISPKPTEGTVTSPTAPIEEPCTQTEIHLPNERIYDEPITFYQYTCPEMFEIVRGLSYMPYTCDGLPDTSITDSDGTVYQLNFRNRWVWRNYKEQAYMPDRLYHLFCGE